MNYMIEQLNMLADALTHRANDLGDASGLPYAEHQKQQRMQIAAAKALELVEDLEVIDQ